jgi:hypothetical protein
MTGKSYLELLSNWLIPELDNVGLLNSVILQQDRATAHYAAGVCAFLNNQFPLWIGQRGPFIWPSRSPDLMMCNSWLWSFVKGQLGTICMHSFAEFKGKVCCIFNTITSLMLQWASQCTWRRM